MLVHILFACAQFLSQDPLGKSRKLHLAEASQTEINTNVPTHTDTHTHSPQHLLTTVVYHM